MPDYRTHLGSLRSLKADKRRVAFFDLDRTLIAVYSAVPLLMEQVKAKQVSVVGAAQQIFMALGLSRDVYDFEEVLDSAIGMLEGVSEQEFIRIGDRLFHKHLQKKLYAEAQELVDTHRQLGHHLVIVSSATRYQIEPVAEALGIETILCTELEVRAGEFTGVVKGEPCWAEGKFNAAHAWSKQHKVNLKNAWFYTDALEDLPLLDAVGHPVAINPTQALEDHALSATWPICKFRSRARATLMDLARTGAMFGAMAPAILTGKAAKWLGAADTHRAALMSFTSYAENALDLAGVKLEVKNEKYLWEQRPAIFVINHQSVLDGYLTPALVKRDYFMMGKMEAGNVPVLGQMLKDAGFILFDRTNREAAIAACDDAAERIKQGYSLCISPEGTRSFSKRMEPFKKGVFHIALQTGVPIVPIVVKNASELWPRGQNFVRPGTLHIEILKPIATSNWTRETLDKNLADLHQKYLKALDTPD
jgi:putative phosphoserine phosphatase/1-acylglycerol-3-phosphate O-acyltransferase